MDPLVVAGPALLPPIGKTQTRVRFKGWNRLTVGTQETGSVEDHESWLNVRSAPIEYAWVRRSTPNDLLGKWTLPTGTQSYGEAGCSKVK